MFDIFLIINILLISFAAVLFYRNRIWIGKKRYLMFFVVIVVCFLAILLIQ